MGAPPRAVSRFPTVRGRCHLTFVEERRYRRGGHPDRGRPPPDFRGERCLLGTLLHEVGHFFGLEHSPAPAIMEAETSSCILALTDGDRGALSARYVEVVGSPTANSPASADAATPSSDSDAVKALIRYQFSLFRSGSWQEVYKTYAPDTRRSAHSLNSSE